VRLQTKELNGDRIRILQQGNSLSLSFHPLSICNVFVVIFLNLVLDVFAVAKQRDGGMKLSFQSTDSNQEE